MLIYFTELILEKLGVIEVLQELFTVILNGISYTEQLLDIPLLAHALLQKLPLRRRQFNFFGSWQSLLGLMA